MTDRIAELRARLATRDEALANARLLPWGHDEGTVALVALRNARAATDEALPALLDCAEALREVTATMEWHAHGGCRATDGPIMSSADAVAMGKAAIAKLNGDDA